MPYGIVITFEQGLALFSGRDPKEITPEKRLKEDFGIKGEIFKEMILGFNEELGLEIDISDNFSEINTVADLKRYLMEKNNQNVLT